MALCKRAFDLCSNHRLCLTKYRDLDYVIPSMTLQSSRFLSQAMNSNLKRAFLVDTLALVRGLEDKGVPSKQAEAITSAITQVLNDSLENVVNSFVSKIEMQKSEVLQESSLSKFKSEVQSSQDLEFPFYRITKRRCRVEDGMLRLSISHIRGEGGSAIEGDDRRASYYAGKGKKRSRVAVMPRSLVQKYEIDKVTAGQRLDLNLERGRIRDELANQNAETSSLTNKLDREIHELRAHVEAAKYDVIKYCIGTLVSISAVGLAVIRIIL
ncbi:hypothetical protein V8G54_006956 [Vigna mungo]|uniref:Uncharacterized protein n=1 Tax=Vigna mungo TaxID=3915 RepID=A0AAQ3P0T9_VIGMU